MLFLINTSWLARAVYQYRQWIMPVLGLLLCFCAVVNGAENRLHVTNITLENGLSQNTVTGIVQDEQGFIWFGTQDGLNRFDGYKVKVYQPDPDNPHALSNNSVWALYVDKRGTLWIGTYAGLNRYDRKRDAFVSYQHDPDVANSISDNDVRAIQEDRFGVLWVGTNGGGLNAFDPRSGTFTHYRHDPESTGSIRGNAVQVIYEDRQGVLWVGSNGGLDRYDRTTKQFIHYGNTKNENRPVRALYEDDQEHLWVGTEEDGLVVYDRDRKKIGHYRHDPDKNNTIANNTVMAIYEDSNGFLWLGTDGGGLDNLDRESGRFFHHRHTLNDPYSISDNRIMALYEDRSGVFWIGTYSGGVNLYNRYSFASSLNRNIPTDGSLLNHRYIRAFFVDRSSALWVGTESGGVSRTDKKGTTRYYRHDPDKPATLANDRVFSIYEDIKGRMWIGSGNGWLNKLDWKTGIVARYSSQLNQPGNIQHGNVRAMLEDKHGDFWVATDGGGIHQFDPETGLFKHYHHDSANPNSLSSNRVFSIYEDSQGILWIATFGGGLNIFNPDSQTFTHYRNNPGDQTSLSHDYVMMVYEDENNNLWVGTYGGGLNRFDREKNTFVRYGEEAGLPNNSIYGILSDESGILWLSHNKGLSRFDVQGKEVKNYDVRDGLQSNEFNGGAYYKGPDGKLYFGGLNGYNAFYPRDIRDNPYIPQLVITDFQLFNKSVPIGVMDDGRTLLNKAINETDAITLSYKDYVFSLEFAAQSFVQPMLNKYVYIMEGFEEHWNSVGNRHFATYTALPPGEYIFKVKASNNNDIWNEEGIRFNITITPPFWETWWFRAIVGMLLIVLVFTVYAMRVRAIQVRNIMLKEEVKVRTVELEVQKANLEKTLDELHETKDALVEAARKAGMADTATGVLHNIGNLLNSVNTSVGLVRMMVKNPAADNFYKANELLRTNFENIESFITEDPKGKKLMQYYLGLEKALRQENSEMKENILRLSDKITAIADAIAAQQRYARGHDFSESLSLEKIVLDTLKLQSGVLEKHGIKIEKIFAEDVPRVLVQKTKLVQILMNLYKNSKESMHEFGGNAKTLTIYIYKDENNAYIKVTDTGYGVNKEKLANIFAYGFSTKANGHGFGLHSSANYMTEMGGKMWAESEGEGRGATFILSFPLVEVNASTD